jgi:zinc/manganese transport system permease protein
MLADELVRNAFLAGSPIALASGLVGYFLVLRTQVFAADALSHVAFTGAIAAAVAGVDLRLGLFGSTLLVALVFAGLGRRARPDDVVIGVVFAWVLGIGVLLLDYFSAGAQGGNGILAARTLFGSLFSLDATHARTAAIVGTLVSLCVLGLARPLLFASVDPATAGVRGVRVRLVGTLFLVLLSVDVAEATQAVGALLLLGLLAAPAGAALRLTARPFAALGLSAAFGLFSVWAGIGLAYAFQSLPPSTAIVGVAAAVYLAAAVLAPRPMIGPWGR